jgi:hypothetical protein
MQRVLRRGTRIAAIFVAVFGILYVRFSSGIWRENEVSSVVHWGMFPIALLFAFAAAVLEASGASSEARRDALWALAGSVSGYALLHLVGVV